MPYTLRIIFSGLCAFVAERRLDSTDAPPTRATVLFRDLHRGLRLGDITVEPHFARIEVPNVNVRAEKSDRSITRDGLIASSDFAREDLEIILPGAPLRIDAPGGTVSFSTAPDESSIAFMPTIEEVSGRAMRVKSALLGPLTAAEPLLAGRVVLTRGKLSTSQLQVGTWGILPIGTVVSGSPADGRRLARSIALDIPGLTGEVELRFKPFGGGKGSSVVVGPPLDAPNRLVVLNLKNLERPELAPQPQPVTPPARDLDFAIYFDLLEPFTDELPRVIPHLLSPEPRGGGVVTHIGGCTPVVILGGGDGNGQ
jgi:hypothetical protein